MISAFQCMPSWLRVGSQDGITGQRLRKVIY